MTDVTIIGTPPTLEWIALERLSVDSRYQRATDGGKSRHLIATMARLWDWRLCQPLAVSRRADGSMLVVDGQHRLEGARRRGDIAFLPCVVTIHADMADEAATFVALNQRRQRLGQADIFAASLASGDPLALKAFGLIEAAGLSLARHSNTTAWKPGQINCAPAVQAALKTFGEKVVSCALVALAEAYSDVVLIRAGTILPALYVIYRDHTDTSFDPDALIEALGSVQQADWVAEAVLVRHGNPQTSTRDALVAAILREYRAVNGKAAA